MVLPAGRLSRLLLLTASSTLVSCTAELRLPVEAVISCNDSSDCPHGTLCRSDNHECADPESSCLQHEGELLLPAADGNRCSIEGGLEGSCLGGACDAHCGDGLLTVGLEACDEGDDTAQCNANCTLSQCGDGWINRTANEQCDDGAESATCDTSCHLKNHLDLGGNHSCVVLEDAVKCWGNDGYGQLGIAGVDRGWAPGQMGGNLAAVDLGFVSPVVAVTAGAVHTCALSQLGILKCWGGAVQGQLGSGETASLGDDTAEMGAALPTVDLGAGAVVAQISAGRTHTCAALVGGAVKCFGDNGDGLLGLGVGYGSADPALTCIGDQSGEMGEALAPVDLGGGALVAQVETGARFTCARLEDGSVKCWGIRNNGRLGDEGTPIGTIGGVPGHMGDNLPRVDLGAQAFAVGLSTGEDHVCALLKSGGVKCWGGNGQGQLGYGHTQDIGDQLGEMGDDLRPVDLGTGAKAVIVAAGGHHTCAVLEDGAVKCWGDNAYGQLGRGDTTNRGDQPDEMGDNLSPVDLGTGAVAVSLAAGEFHTCAWLQDGRLKCWGHNIGQLGLGDTDDRGDGPGEMGDSLPAVDIGPVR